MQWSKIKERIEERFAPALAGRVAVHYTQYRLFKAEHGRGWITVDGQQIADLSDLRFLNLRDEYEGQIQSGTRRFDGQYIAVQPGYAAPRATSALHQRGIYSGWEFFSTLSASLTLTVEQMLGSDNGLLRALAVVDRRLGKRRLRALDLPHNEIALVRTLYRCRCDAEGIAPRPDLSPSVGKTYIVMQGEVPLGSLAITHAEPPWFSGRFDAAPGYETVRSLFEEAAQLGREARRLYHNRCQMNADEWEHIRKVGEAGVKATKRIARLGLTLAIDESTIRYFHLEVDGADARLRYDPYTAVVSRHQPDETISGGI